MLEIQKIKFKSSRKHHIWTKVESEISSLNQKSNFRSSIFESFFSFENQFEHIFIDLCQFISFFNIFDEININFSKQWSNQKSNHYIKYFRSNFHFFDRIRIIYLFRKSFKIIFVFLANRSFFFIHSINSIFRLKIFKFIHNIFSNNQHWNHFFQSRIDHKTYLLIITNRHIFFVIRIISINEFENQSIFWQNFQYWQSRINIWIIFDFWKISKITSVYLTNWLEFSSFVMKLIAIRIRISNRFFKFFIFSFNISIERYKINIENIRFFRNHCDIISVLLTKNFVFFDSTLSSIYFYQKRQKIFNEILHQHLILNLFIVFENLSKLHSIAQ